MHVDWGPEFLLHHGGTFPDITPGLSVDFGPLGLSYILAAGGSGYFRARVVKPHIASGRLRLVPNAPRFAYPIYAVYSTNTDDAVLSTALTGLHRISSEQGK